MSPKFTLWYFWSRVLIYKFKSRDKKQKIELSGGAVILRDFCCGAVWAAGRGFKCSTLQSHICLCSVCVWHIKEPQRAAILSHRRHHFTHAAAHIIQYLLRICILAGCIIYKLCVRALLHCYGNKLLCLGPTALNAYNSHLRHITSIKCHIIYIWVNAAHVSRLKNIRSNKMSIQI